MKRLSIIGLLACALLTTGCESDDTLNDTRIPDVTAPSISLSEVTVDKYDATFSVNVTEIGNPAIREYGVLISTEAQPTIDNSTVVAAAGTEELTATLSASLAPGTDYYVCAYALTANQMVTSEVKQFATDPHKLGAFLGRKELVGFNFHAEGASSVAVTIAADDSDESVAYLTGLSSNAGVQLALGPVKMVFDLEAGTVTIPEGQVIAEQQYGDYLYAGMDAEGNAITGDIVGTIQDGTIHFDALAAVIVVGQNQGLSHWAFSDINIQ